VCAMEKEIKIKDLTDPLLMEDNWNDVKENVQDIADKDRPEKIFSIKFAFGNKEMMDLLKLRGDLMQKANYEKVR
jgi:hypothetical protein